MFIIAFTNETWLFVLPHTKPVARHLLFKHVPVFIIRIGFERKGLTYDNSLSPFISVCLSISETIDFTGFELCYYQLMGSKTSLFEKHSKKHFGLISYNTFKSKDLLVLIVVFNMSTLEFTLGDITKALSINQETNPL